MSNGEALRAVVQANPTDPLARLVFADWLDENDQLGGDLIRALINYSLGDAVPHVVEWFHRHYDWPLMQQGNVGEWVWEALMLGRWPDWEQFRECVSLIAHRMLPFAKFHLSVGGAFPEARLLVRAATSPVISEMPSGGRVAFAAAYMAAGLMCGPDAPSDAVSHREYCEQVHIIAWVWLYLPPFHSPPTMVRTTPAPRSWWRRLFGG